LSKLAQHSKPPVASAATRVQQELATDLIATGAAHLRAERARQPGRSVLFEQIDDPHERRQVLRWLAHDRDASNVHLTEVLRSGLRDPDWETRATALVVTGRLGAAELAKEVRQAEIAGAEQHFTQRPLMIALKKGVLALFAGELPDLPGEGVTTARPDSHDAVGSHLRALILGQPTPWKDGLFLLAHGLTTPLPFHVPPPHLPEYVTESEGGYTDTSTGHALQWVPAISHWLGADREIDTDLDASVRAVTPATGFFITRDPADAVDAAGLEGACASLSLPTPDQWEMAMRGPDGRRHPWGNGSERGAERHPSPWGCMNPLGAQWCRNSDGALVVCGDDPNGRCAARRVARPGERAAVRLVRPASCARRR
jgi:hypothetical protein